MQTKSRNCFYHGRCELDAYKGQQKFQGNAVPLRALMVLYPNAKCTW